ncbi:hypothetical protein [Niallia sp. RD1]|uniref:hypothetical protein n=1 Tax=Niallia sp. RD1 TaxID=2962858 RepID=UPI0020C197CF|nr:hypothetical protein [Niallia sp. RD1]UTI42124.1 hypothetical protein NKG37_25485 [Niallia sp. RD1]
MTTLTDIQEQFFAGISVTELFAEMNLDELFHAENKIDDIKLELYSPLGEIEMDEASTDEQLAYAKKEGYELDKIFKIIDKTLAKTVEVASLKEMNEQTA